jgi:hypothetical protein
MNIKILISNSKQIKNISPSNIYCVFSVLKESEQSINIPRLYGRCIGIYKIQIPDNEFENNIVNYLDKYVLLHMNQYLFQDAKIIYIHCENCDVAYSIASAFKELLPFINIVEERSYNTVDEIRDFIINLEESEKLLTFKREVSTNEQLHQTIQCR